MNLNPPTDEMFCMKGKLSQNASLSLIREELRRYVSLAVLKECSGDLVMQQQIANNPEIMVQLMNNPMMKKMMENVMTNDPDLLNSIIQANPRLTVPNNLCIQDLANDLQSCNVKNIL